MTEVEVATVLAPNPGIFTGPGTNTYVLARGSVAVVIDPGPVIEEHMEAIVEALGDRGTAAVLVTHSHPDHAPAANPLAARLGAPAVGFGPGPDFSPDITLADGETFARNGIELIAVHTPGHTSDHLCYLVGDTLFTGDHVMGGSTVVIEDAAAYMDSLEKVLRVDPSRLLPGHGPELPDARSAVTGYIEHRRMRERQIVAAVGGGAETIDEIVAVVYADVDASLHFAAAMQVDTVLQKLTSEGRLSFRRGTDEGGTFHVVEDQR